MKIWNQFAMGLLLAVPLLGETASAAKAPTVPILLEAALPAYPPIWRAAHLSGKVIVLVTVKDGQVVGTDVKYGLPELQFPTIANLKTWRFASDVNGSFTVTYSYVIAGNATDNPTNPKVEILPTLDVNITARPVKPTVNYGAQGQVPHS
ncbi:MAG: hypothetical protein ABSD44_14295 [Terracidiphilus sp.]